MYRNFFLITTGLFVAFKSYARDVDITKYGAVGDGVTLNTIAIQKAIDVCNNSGGGKVMFPSGRFLSGTIVLKDNIDLFFQEKSVLLGSTDLKDYKNLDPFTEGLGIDVGWALLVGVDVKNIAIEGSGEIDGQGLALKARQLLTDTRPEGQRWGVRPFLLRIVRCTNVKVKGITLKRSAAWTSHYSQSERLCIEGVTIRSVGVAHNDGIGIDGCTDVVIKNCDVVSGDDALVFKTTSSKYPCKNIEVHNLKLKSNQAGIKMGTESMANFENINIHNCELYDIHNGGIKLLSVDGAQIKDVLISDIVMTNIRTPILLRLGSRLSVFRRGQDEQQKTGFFQNVLLKNISAVSSDSTQLRSATGIMISGVPQYKITDVTLENIQIELPGGGSMDQVKAVVPEAIDKYPEVKTFGPVIPAYGLWLRHARNITIKNLEVRLRNNDLRPAVFMEDTHDVQLRQSTFAETKNSSSIIQLKGTGAVTIEKIRTSSRAKVFINADEPSKQTMILKENKIPGILKMFN